MDFKVFAVLVLLSVPVCAENMTIYSFDLNTRGGIPGAEVSFIERENVSNVFNSTNADAYGTAYMDEGSLTNYTVRINQTGYIPYYENRTSGTGNQITAYLYPSSSAGLIRLRFQDMTIGGENRELCVFFVENGRLYQCYRKNETVVLLTMHNYTFVPTLEKSDLLSSVSNMRKFFRMYGGVVISGGALILAFGVTLTYLLVFQWKKR